MSFTGFWKSFGKWAFKGTKWATQHEGLAETIAVAVGHPEDAQLISEIAPVVDVVTNPKGN